MQTVDPFDVIKVRGDGAYALTLTPTEAQELARQLKVAVHWANRSEELECTVELFINVEGAEVTALTSDDEYMSSGVELQEFDIFS